MALIDLKKYSGLALAFDGSTLAPQENGVEIGSKETVTIQDVRPQILNPELSCPTVFYYVFSRLDRKSLLKRKNLKFDMCVIPPNLAGIEYVKTRGISVGSYPVLLDVAHGFVMCILQADVEGEDQFDMKTRTVAIRLKRGEKIVVPPEHSFTLVNTRQSLAVVSMIYSSRSRLRKVFDDTRGAASYVIRKNARLEVVRNPSYRNVEKLKSWKPESTYKVLNLTAKTPIFKQILRKYQRFKWLHDSSKIDWNKLPTCN